MSKSFYKHCLSAELQQQVHDQLCKLIPEQLDLTEEVAIHKARCADLVKDWSTKRDMYRSLMSLSHDPQNIHLIDKSRLAMDVAAQRMADALKEHKDLAITAATVESKTREAVTERTIMLFLNAAIDLAHEMFNLGTADTIQRMKEFEQQLRERVVVQDADTNALAIEGEIWAMMQTIEGPGADMSLNELSVPSSSTN